MFKFNKKFILLVFVLSIFGCADVIGFKNQMNDLKSLIDNKADAHTTAESINEVKNKIEQNQQLVDDFITSNKTINADTVNEFGIAGAVITTIIFLIFIHFMVKRREKMLELVAQSIQSMGPSHIKDFKETLESYVKEDPRFCDRDKKRLAQFVKKKNLFAS